LPPAGTYGRESQNVVLDTKCCLRHPLFLDVCRHDTVSATRHNLECSGAVLAYAMTCSRGPSQQRCAARHEFTTTCDYVDEHDRQKTHTTLADLVAGSLDTEEPV
jgi:hypothetical protein